jgi:hypothetical protein
MIVLEVGTYQSDKMALPEDNNVRPTGGLAGTDGLASGRKAFHRYRPDGRSIGATTRSDSGHRGRHSIPIPICVSVRRFCRTVTSPGRTGGPVWAATTHQRIHIGLTSTGVALSLAGSGS